MPLFTAEEALDAAAEDMDIVAFMIAAAQRASVIDLNTAAELRTYLIAALYQRRVDRGELEPR